MLVDHCFTLPSKPSVSINTERPTVLLFVFDEAAFCINTDLVTT